jgi:hypothetical protein
MSTKVMSEEFCFGKRGLKRGILGSHRLTGEYASSWNDMLMIEKSKDLEDLLELLESFETLIELKE